MLLRPPFASRTYMARLTALGLAFAGAGVFALVRPTLEAPAAHAPTAIAPPAVEVSVIEQTAAAVEAPPAARTRAVNLAFREQNRWLLKLADYEESIPHGAITFVGEEYSASAFAPIEAKDVPAAHRDRLFGKVTIGSCTATITGFAVVARLTGTTSYADVGDDTAWTPSNVLSQGSPMLAATLSGCDITEAAIARDTMLAPVARAIEIPLTPALAAAAKQKVIASVSGRAAEKEWQETYKDGSSWDASEATQWTIKALRHETTGELFVMVHGHQLEGCGAPHVNAFGVYRVLANGSLRGDSADLGDIETVKELVDLDGDGTFEVFGTAWLGSTMINDLHGQTLQKLDEPFFGCPC